MTLPTDEELDELLGKPGPPIEVDPEELAAAVALQRAEALALPRPPQAHRRRQVTPQ